MTPRVSPRTLGLLALLLLDSSALAGDIVVDPPESIQAAIDAAADGDRVLVNPGTYTETIDFLGKAIEVIGVQGAEVTILDGAQGGTVVTFTTGEGPDSILRGFTVTGGSKSGVVSSGTPVVADCALVLNSGKNGAGFHGTGRLERCTIQYNVSSLQHGGGVWGSPTLIECSILENSCTSAYGGGVYLVGGAPLVQDCLLKGNRSVLTGGRGGGIYVDSTSQATIERCVIVDNYTVAGNFGAYGGGVFVEAAGTTIDHCTILRNLINGSTELGGGVYGPATITNSIVRDNDAPELSNTAAVTWSDVAGGAAGVGNIDADPLFWDAANDDFALRAGSPCIDAGDPGSPPDADGSVTDMGAVTFDPLYAPPPTVYCIAAPNSAGAGANISTTGSQSLAANDLFLNVTGCPANQFGLFFYGSGRDQKPAGDGWFCVGAPFYRLDPVQCDGAGQASTFLDTQNPPNSEAQITAGSTWNFQFWYRDPAAGGATYNFSDAIEVGFTL